MPRGHHLRAPDPAPEEIRDMCLEIQATWTPEERAKRACAEMLPTPVSLGVPVIARRDVVRVLEKTDR